ncbi:MAG: hypothetical protein MUC68_04665 [Burkholderiaceae bacterium]|jgi:hypothetical protein|nr:hypothetical protein [Burkholderiaceae bacterium]
MLMRVRESGDRIVIELSGVAGRHESVLRALSACRQGSTRDEAVAAADVSVRAGANDMRICLQARDGLPMAPDLIYRSLRQALFADPARTLDAKATAAV